MSDWYVRFETGDGLGLMDRGAWDLGLLSDEEDQELVELLTYGLEQPRGVPGGAVFAFTREGLGRHRRLVELLGRAVGGDVEELWLDPGDYEVVWRSGDGQVALLPLGEDVGMSERVEVCGLVGVAVSEGLLGRLRGALGAGSGGEFGIIPKGQWERLVRDNRQAVDMIANTPALRDVAGLVYDLLNELVEQGSMEARKALQDIRVARRNKDAAGLAQVIRGIKQEADRIRTVRSGALLRVRESVEDIAGVVSEDIGVNNGLVVG